MNGTYEYMYGNDHTNFLKSVLRVVTIHAIPKTIIRKLNSFDYNESIPFHSSGNSYI
jgi:hypothetical protein